MPCRNLISLQVYVNINSNHQEYVQKIFNLLKAFFKNLRIKVNYRKISQITRKLIIKCVWHELAFNQKHDNN